MTPEVTKRVLNKVYLTFGSKMDQYCNMARPGIELEFRSNRNIIYWESHSNFWGGPNAFILYDPFYHFRHIVLRQDHYECTVLFLMRRARLDIKNQNGQIPAECIVIKNPKCGTIVKLSTTMCQLMKDTPKTRLEKIIINDLTHGKEANPIQCVNVLDDALEPIDYVYVKQNCSTTSIPVDRNIATLQVFLLYFQLSWNRKIFFKWITNLNKIFNLTKN
jgi:hypothetical protein